MKEVSASVTVVPANLMKDQSMQSLADVIRYVPGALARQGEGNRDEFILRGIGTSANRYVDGDKKYFSIADRNNNLSSGASRNFRLTLATAF